MNELQLNLILNLCELLEKLIRFNVGQMINYSWRDLFPGNTVNEGAPIDLGILRLLM